MSKCNVPKAEQSNLNKCTQLAITFMLASNTLIRVSFFYSWSKDYNKKTCFFTIYWDKAIGIGVSLKIPTFHRELDTIAA